MKLTDYARREMCRRCGKSITNIMLILFLAASWSGFVLFAFGQMDKCPTMRKLEAK